MWEYLTETVDNKVGKNYLVSRYLDQLGSEGWELVNFSTIHSCNGEWHTHYVFKRKRL